MPHERVGLDPQLEQVPREGFGELLGPPLGAETSRSKRTCSVSVGVKAVKSWLPTRRGAALELPPINGWGHQSALPASNGCPTGEASTR